MSAWFHRLITSHGWYALAPFAYDEASQTLRRVHQLPGAAPFLLEVRAAGDQPAWAASAPLAAAQRAEVDAAVRRMLSLHWPLEELYGLARDLPRYRWVAEQAMGRLLVSPTVWEDLAKTLMTTNTTWAQTRQMVARLCALGDPLDEGRWAFPTPQRIAALPPDELAARIRAGYRAAYLHALAQRISAGEDVEAWRALPSDELYRRVRSLKGFGDYAAGTMLRLLGHFDRLAIDTECRAAFRRIHGRPAANDSEISAYYAPFGRWRGLLMWMDVIAD